MKDELITILEKQILEEGHEDQIQDLTLAMIDEDDFEDLPDEVQSLIYQLNMNDLNDFTKEDYAEILSELKKNK